MKKQIKSDAVLKIFSAVIAICLWFYVVQVESPDMDRTIKNIPVVFSQQSTLEDKNLILLNDNEYTVDVKIHGPRKYAMDVDRKNLTVLADVGNISSTGQHVITTSVVLPYANLEVVNKNPSTLTIDVDHLVTVEKPVEVHADGTPKAPFVVGNLTANPETVSITGPKSIIDGIQTVAATMDVSNKSTDAAALMPLKVFGNNDNEIRSQLLSVSSEEVEVRAEILKSKTVALTPQFTNDASQYELDESSIKEIRVAGVQTLVDALSSAQTEPISTNDINENGEVTVELSLPQGIKSLDGDTFTLRFVTPEAAEVANQTEEQ